MPKPIKPPGHKERIAALQQETTAALDMLSHYRERKPLHIETKGLLRGEFGAGIASVGEKYLGHGKWGYCDGGKSCLAKETHERTVFMEQMARNQRKQEKEKDSPERPQRFVKKRPGGAMFYRSNKV